MFQRIILHIDLDSFFVEVERLLDPSLVGQPVIVGGDPDGRGVVSSASYEARKFGVHSAMPMSRARQLCPHGRFVKVGTGDYGEYSRRVHAILDRFSPLVQMSSIDEAYVDLTGTQRLNGPPMQAATALRETIRNELSLPASCGIGANKLVAKVASDAAKPRGLLYIIPGAEAAYFATLPLRKLPGIGRRMAETLERYNLRTLGDIQKMGPELLCGALGERAGAELYDRACGRHQGEVVPSSEAKSVSRETTFEQDTAHVPTLESTLSYLSERVAQGLRRHEYRAKTITLKLRYSDFKTVTRATSLSEPTDDDRAIFNAAKGSLHKLDLRRVRVRLLGVSAGNLSNAQWQIDFLEQDHHERDLRLAGALDKIKERYGFQAILRARSRKK